MDTKKEDSVIRKSALQIKLFNYISRKLPKHISLVDVVGELFNLKEDAAYKRMKGAVYLDIEEINILCKKFNISFDSIMGNDGVAQFELVPSNISDMSAYFAYPKELVDKLVHFKAASNCHIYMTAVEINALTMLQYKELTTFSVFSWFKNNYSYKGDYSQFDKDYKMCELLTFNNKISELYKEIPSTEIWNVNTIDSFIKSLLYHHALGHFTDSEVPLRICSQISEYLDLLKDWACTGSKGDGGASFHLYKSEVDIGSSMSFFQSDYISFFLLRLFSISGLQTSDNYLCSEAKNWFKKVISKSILISAASEKERYKFFDDMQQKLKDAMNILQSKVLVDNDL